MDVMTTSLRPAPRLTGVLKEQLRVIWSQGRRDWLIIVAAATLPSWSIMHATYVPSRQSGFNVPHSIFLIGGLSLAVGAWRMMRPSRREYFSSLPVNYLENVAVRVFAGWVLLMLSIIAVLLLNAFFLAGLQLAHEGRLIAPLWDTLTPSLVAAFAAPTVIYLLFSIIYAGSDHPSRWLMISAIAYVLIEGIIAVDQSSVFASVARSIWSGEFGLGRALFTDGGSVVSIGFNLRGEILMARPDPAVVKETYQAAAAALWAGIGMLGVLLTSLWRQQR